MQDDLSCTLTCHTATVQRSAPWLALSATACGVPPLTAEAEARHNHLQRGWYWGSPAFADALLKQHALRDATSTPQAQAGETAPARVLRSHGEVAAQRFLESELRQNGLTGDALALLPGNAPIKVVLARKLRAHTQVNNAWLAKHLAMKSAGNVAQILHQTSI